MVSLLFAHSILLENLLECPIYVIDLTATGLGIAQRDA